MSGLFGEDAPRRRWATLSNCGRYRNVLGRTWSEGPWVGFLMFNPSKADALIDDHTIRKNCGFAQRWGYGGMIALNLWPWRSTDPREIARVADPVGPDGNRVLLDALRDVQILVCAWGCSAHMKGELRKRPAEVMRLIQPWVDAGGWVGCLGYSKDGSPRHPLMLAYDTPLEKFEVRG